MSDHPVRPRALVLPLVAAGLLAACGTDVVLPPATQPVAQQQITLSALSGTDVLTPSAYNMIYLLEIWTHETTDFDFAFEIGPDTALGVGTTGDTVAVLLPRGALGFAPDGGFQRTTIPYDSILRGPLEGYVGDKPIVIRTGDVVLASSRLQQCAFSVIRPRVAKLRIDAVDFTQRRTVIYVTIDPNCGYLSLAPGVPSN